MINQNNPKGLHEGSQVGGWITVTHRRFAGYDKKQMITVNGTNHSYCLPKYKKPLFKAFWKHNLLTTDGRDQMHSQCYNETVAGNTERGAGYIAVSTNATTPAAGDTVLTSEATGGLARADATTNTHTDNTNVTTLAKTFTADATFTNVHKSGTFDASSSGILYHEAAFSSDATLVSGDTLTVTWTLTLG